MPDPIVPAGQPEVPSQQPAGATPAAPQAGAQPVSQSLQQADPAWLGARLRAAKAAAEKSARDKLLAEMGVDDPEKFKLAAAERDKKLAEYERTKVEADRANMTEVERLKGDLGQRDQRIAELESQLQRREVDVQAARFDVVVQGTISESIDPTMQEDAQAALRRHILALPKEQQKRFGKAESEAFFRKLAKDKPGYARAGAAPAAPKSAPLKRPLSNGASPAKAAGTPAAKLPVGATPGNGAKPKSKAEIAESWKKFGATRPY